MGYRDLPFNRGLLGIEWTTLNEIGTKVRWVARLFLFLLLDLLAPLSQPLGRKALKKTFRFELSQASRVRSLVALAA